MQCVHFRSGVRSLSALTRASQADLFADFLLIFIPIRALWRSKLDPKHRRLILVLFAASILTALASFPQAATQIWIGGSFTQLASQVEVSTSITTLHTHEPNTSLPTEIRQQWL